MSIAEKLQTIAENEQKVFDAGKQAQEQEFWDSYQDNGNRTRYNYAFAQMGWTNECFKPKYDIKPTHADYMFRDNPFKGDLAAYLESLGIVLDLTNNTALTQSFRAMRNVTRLPVIDCSLITSLNYCFSENTALETIDKIIVSDTGKTTFVNMFLSTPKLKEIRFEGVIGTSINFQQCPLSAESAKSVIKALSTEVTRQSVTFSPGTWTELEKETRDDGLTWQDYVTYSLGWTV